MSLTQENMNSIIAEVRACAANRSGKLSFKQLKDHHTGRLEVWDDEDSIDCAQMNKLMDEIVLHNFSSIDLSGNCRLDSEVMGVALCRLAAHYIGNLEHPLLELHLAKANLDFQSGALFDLLTDPQCRLRKLDLSNTLMLESDLIHVCNSLSANISIEDLSLPTNGVIHNPFYGNNGYLPGKMCNTALAIGQMLEQHQALKSLDLSGWSLENESIEHIFLGLAKCKIAELSIHAKALLRDKQLAPVIAGNSSIEHLKLNVSSGMAGMSQTVLAALQSPNLKKLSLKGVYFRNYNDEFFTSLAERKADVSQLYSISLRGCDVDNRIMEHLKYFPLRELNLANCRLYGNREGLALYDLLPALRDSLIVLNLAGNTTLESSLDQNKHTLVRGSTFLQEFPVALHACQHLRQLNLDFDNGFEAIYRQFHFMRRMRKINPNMQIFETMLEQYGDPFNFEIYVKYHLLFFIQESQKRNDLSFSNKGNIEERWPTLEKFYKNSIKTRLNWIIKCLDRKHNGDSFDRRFGIKRNPNTVVWSEEHASIVAAGIAGQYDLFYRQWEEWKLSHADMSENIDPELSMLMDFAGETILCYADAIKQFATVKPEWINTIPEWDENLGGYLSKINRLEENQIENRKGGDARWKAERAEEDAREAALRKQAKEAAAAQEAEAARKDEEKNERQGERSKPVKQTLFQLGHKEECNEGVNEMNDQNYVK